MKKLLAATALTTVLVLGACSDPGMDNGESGEAVGAEETADSAGAGYGDGSDASAAATDATEDAAAAPAEAAGAEAAGDAEEGSGNRISISEDGVKAEVGGIKADVGRDGKPSLEVKTD